MLNKAGERELAYVAKVEEVKSIDGYDRVEYARIGAGWWLVVKKDQFKPGDHAIYFEPDSKVPAEEPFMFLENKKFKIKTQRMCKVVSQGLLMSFDDFVDADGRSPYWLANLQAMKASGSDIDGYFLTKDLKVTYADDEDNVRKAPSRDRYRSMQDRHKKLFKSKFGKWMMKKEWRRKIMFALFGKKKDKKTDWPIWVKKTDEERVQNMSWLFPSCPTEWVATEKIDGTSTTFTMRNDKKKDLLVCSRNVVYNTPEKEARNYYKDSDGNVYLEMASKYNMKNVLANMIIDLEKEFGYEGLKKKVEFVTIQGETYGGSIQKRNYGPEHRLAVFNVIYKHKGEAPVRMNPIQGKLFVERFGLSYVPIVAEHFKLHDSCDKTIEFAHGLSAIDGQLREGLVFRDYSGENSFKAVDPEFLLKYHAN